MASHVPFVLGDELDCRVMVDVIAQLGVFLESYLIILTQPSERGFVDERSGPGIVEFPHHLATPP